MLPDSIVLPVDEANDETVVNETLTRLEEYANRSVYASESHVVGSPDTLSFYRTPPKQTGNFRGVFKTATKFSRAITVAGVDGTTTISAPIIVETSYSIPVGATKEQILLARQRNIALQDLDAVMDPHQAQGMI